MESSPPSMPVDSPVSLDALIADPAAAPAACTASSLAVITARNRIKLLFSLQDEARKALENALGKKAEFDKWGVEIERRQRGYPRDPAACGGGWSGGGSWFRRLTGGGFWDAAKQTVLTILGIIAAFFLIANFNILVASVINSLLLVLRQIRRILSFIAYCVFQGALVERSGPKSSTLGLSNVAGVPVKEKAGMSAKERVVGKWAMD
ncbi:uncharacterized protein [Zea mays]|uniref:Uncharacterized protein n=1 Tax=Zea mays TaxID=4577 RepID=A0A804UDC0_MAIZE|nr:uncharacterized protein LOC111589729 isoform X3 [Zea mays]|eukprot:XP_023156360.1 uncharacterized protein LOC111589729 isoform X3 [Zea mays]